MCSKVLEFMCSAKRQPKNKHLEEHITACCTMHVIYYHFRLVSDITLNKIWQVMVTQKICYGNYYREQPKDYSEGPRRFYS